MKKIINRESYIPLNHQLYLIIKEAIETKEFKEGSIIPSESLLESKYNVSRITVRRAIEDLAKDGLVEKRQGKGTFVCYKKPQYNLELLTSFTEDSRLRGKKPKSKILDFQEIKAFGNIAKSLKISDDTDIYYLKRLRFINDDEIIGLHDTYINKIHNIELSREDFTESTSLYSVLENKFGTQLTEADETLEARMPTFEEKELLKIEDNIPLFYIQRTTYDNQNAIEFVRMSYIADKFKYYTSIKNRNK